MLYKNKKSLLSIIVAFGISALFSSCATVPSHNNVSNNFSPKISNAYNGKKAVQKTAINIKNMQWLDNKDDSVPVILPPVVRPVWIVDHVTPDGVLVRGHWTFVKIRGFEWYIQAIENDQNIDRLLEEGR